MWGITMGILIAVEKIEKIILPRENNEKWRTLLSAYLEYIMMIPYLTVGS